MPAQLPEITPLPLPHSPTETLLDLVERQQITTISVVASSTPSGVDSGPASSEKKGFPVVVAIPALVGGMAAAFGAFGLWWWCSKRNKKQRRERWEAAQRKKQRQRANSAGRPSIASSRGPSATNLKNLAEKDIIPPVPALPKHYPKHGEKQSNYGYDQQQLGYSQQQQQQPHDPYNYQSHEQNIPRAQYPAGYAPQPAIDGPISPTYSDHSTQSGSSSSGSGSGPGSGSTVGSADSSTPLTEKKKTSPTKTGSRSTARVAVADSAAATAGLDANVRYQPKKPSPLALKAMQEKQAAQNAMYGEQETLAPPIQTQGGVGGRNVVSGEWGVALGSPNHDPTSQFSFDQQQQQSQPQNSRYSNDPYLSAHQQRVPSGHYSNDPYAGYHDPVSNATGGQKSNWV